MFGAIKIFMVLVVNAPQVHACLHFFNPRALPIGNHLRQEIRVHTQLGQDPPRAKKPWINFNRLPKELYCLFSLPLVIVGENNGLQRIGVVRMPLQDLTHLLLKVLLMAGEAVVKLCLDVRRIQIQALPCVLAPQFLVEHRDHQIRLAKTLPQRNHLLKRLSRPPTSVQLQDGKAECKLVAPGSIHAHASVPLHCFFVVIVHHLTEGELVVQRDLGPEAPLIPLVVSRLVVASRLQQRSQAKEALTFCVLEVGLDQPLDELSSALIFLLPEQGSGDLSHHPEHPLYFPVELPH